MHISARLDLRSVRFACTPTDSNSISAIAARAAVSFNNFQYEIRLIAAASVHNEAHFCADVIQSRPDFALEPVLFCGSAPDTRSATGAITGTEVIAAI